MHQFYKVVGNHKVYSNCRACHSEKLEEVINLGYVPLAGGFIPKKNLKNLNEFVYPLKLSICSNCVTLQTVVVVDAELLFSNYYYHSSSIKTLVEHFKNLASDFRNKFDDPRKKFVVEIGCNDGSFINILRKNGFKVLGIDPATNIVKPLIKKGFPIINDFFNSQCALKIVKKHGKADIIFSSNVLAHIEDIADVFKGIKLLLKKNGELIMEVHYLKTLLEQFQYDMIYHEHQYYWSTISLSKVLKNFKLQINDLSLIPTHAGSIRFHIGHEGARPISPKVNQQITLEKKLGLQHIFIYKNFAKGINGKKKKLLTLLKKLKEANHSIAGYGASGRGTILSNYSGIDKRYLDFVIDDAKAKQGAFTPGNHLLIRSSKILRSSKRPDYVVLFAWSFIEEIANRNALFLKNGGKFIIPLPDVKIVKAKK